MDARQLEYFLAIVDNGGFGRAAKQLLIAQPSLSQAMAGLERELGVALFHRIGRGVTVSEAGRELVGPARQVLRDLQAAHATVESLKGLLRGRVEVATMPSPAISPLSTLTRLFTEQHPGVTVSTQAAFTTDEVVGMVRGGTCELGLAGSAAPLRHPGIDVLAVEEQSHVLVGAAERPFPEGDPVQSAALAGARLIVSQPGSLMRRIADDIAADGIPITIAVEVAHRTSILALVLEGVGLAVLPSAWAPLARRAGARVAAIDIPVRLHISLISRAAPLTPAAAAFLAVTRSYAGDIGGTYRQDR
ncbi:LysR family transcriptional regulator [Pseudonocardia sp. TRM90224]|uniref:LysR family transcriptional regulator n=1 Tax=Pseudonocardia sp. TRM90224 TaxID=2812678 RepID=UPI001E46FBE1|nr:LysR family transcriptional regulator [Pseudonocardia sp. TRM90224]